MLQFLAKMSPKLGVSKYVNISIAKTRERRRKKNINIAKPSFTERKPMEDSVTE